VATRKKTIKKRKRRGAKKGQPFPVAQPAVPPDVVKELPEAARSFELLTKDQVLKLCGGITHVTLWDWIRQGKFPPARVPGKDGGHRTAIRWIASEVYAAIANMPKRIPKGSTGTWEQPR
jgi:predicted DNA-binding transcriptional regulator AlpA